ncbi:MAG: sporulation protein YqfD, partial [Clostridiales bacterium]|nr:sporulation protein YqfD [Clostridiales bacterium]
EKYKMHTEKEYNSYKIEIFNKNFSINLIKSDTNSKKCDKIESKKQLRLWNDIYLPVIINKTTYLPYSLYERDLTSEAARKKAEKIITAKIINEYPADAQVLNKTLSLEKTEAGYKVSAEIVVIKQIGVFRKG